MSRKGPKSGWRAFEGHSAVIRHLFIDDAGTP
jgi:hypothetical protein